VPIAELLRRRLRNQRLVQSRLRTAADVVAWLGAVQSQDYAAAKWAISLRANNLSEAAIDQAFDRGEILRTHILRPTWHFVRREDLRWLVGLSGPRVNATNASYYRNMEMDAKLFARAHTVFERALENHRYLTRPELAVALEKARIATSGIRLSFLVMQAELAGVICSGPRRGKQFTYALLDERARGTSAMPRDEALGELTRRYFTSHGPATIRDFTWWSGLTVAEAKRGIAIAADALAQHTFDGLACWLAPGRAPRSERDAIAHLLANYDEYFIAYRDRVMFARPVAGKSVPHERSIFAHQVAIDGRLCGARSRTLRAKSVDIAVRPVRPLSKSECRALETAVQRYGRFLQLTPNLALG
jgi:hypothetical protein